MPRHDDAPSGFNPLPAVRPGGTRFSHGGCRTGPVSIRSRLLGREEQDPIFLLLVLRGFNPLPAVRPGGTTWW